MSLIDVYMHNLIHDVAVAKAVTERKAAKARKEGEVNMKGLNRTVTQRREGQGPSFLVYGRKYQTVGLNVPAEGYPDFLLAYEGVTVAYCSEQYLELAEADLSKELTGGSSSYYDIELEGNPVSCIELIDELKLDWNEANMFKAIWRTAAARRGNGKKGQTDVYDAEKIVFFAARKLKEARRVNEST